MGSNAYFFLAFHLPSRRTWTRSQDSPFEALKLRDVRNGFFFPSFHSSNDAISKAPSHSQWQYTLYNLRSNLTLNRTRARRNLAFSCHGRSVRPSVRPSLDAGPAMVIADISISFPNIGYSSIFRHVCFGLEKLSCKFQFLPEFWIWLWIAEGK